MGYIVHCLVLRVKAKFKFVVFLWIRAIVIIMYVYQDIDLLFCVITFD